MRVPLLSPVKEIDFDICRRREMGARARASVARLAPVPAPVPVPVPEPVTAKAETEELLVPAEARAAAEESIKEGARSLIIFKPSVVI